MANSVTHGATPYPIKGCRFTIIVPYLDADGDPTDPTTPDTERSLDGAAFADCTEEVTTISGSNGMGYITLTGDETNCTLLAVCAKVSSGPKATLLACSPRVLPSLSTGTAQAGANGSITLASGAPAYDLTGCIVQTTGGTGGAGGSGNLNNQARVITAYNTSTKVATVVPNWETNPDATTTYAVLLTEVAVNAPAGRFLTPTTDGRTLDVSSGGEAGVDWANVGSPTTTVGLTGTTIATSQVVASVSGAVGSVTGAVGSVGSGGITAASLAADCITAAKIADGAIDAATFAAGAIDATAIATDAIGSAELAASAASEIATAVAAAILATPAQLLVTDSSGRVTVGSIAASAITATSIATDAITAAKIAADAIGASELAADAAQEIADALLDRTAGVETSYTLRQALRLILSACAGKISGAGSGTVTIRDVNDSANRIVATTDADGNRSAVTLTTT